MPKRPFRIEVNMDLDTNALRQLYGFTGTDMDVAVAYVKNELGHRNDGWAVQTQGILPAGPTSHPTHARDEHKWCLVKAQNQNDKALMRVVVAALADKGMDVQLDGSEEDGYDAIVAEDDLTWTLRLVED